MRLPLSARILYYSPKSFNRFINLGGGGKNTSLNNTRLRRVMRSAHSWALRYPSDTQWVGIKARAVTAAYQAALARLPPSLDKILGRDDKDLICSISTMRICSKYLTFLVFGITLRLIVSQMASSFVAISHKSY